MTTEILGIGSRIRHASYGIGVVLKGLPTIYTIAFMQYGVIDIPITDDLEVIEAIEPDTSMVSLNDVKEVLTQLLHKWNGLEEIVEMGSKWEGGKMILKPGSDKLKSKEIPIEGFFHKIVMVRDRLRVMEQRINSSKLTDEEKVNLQQYITRIYGSLTTFNILFKSNKDHFKGASR